MPGAPSDPLPTDPDWAGGSLYVDGRARPVDASPEALWRVIEGIGGEHGWYSFPLAWRVRGLLDRLVGGVGLRRGRRDPDRVYVGETIDFWRVEELEPGRAAAAARRDAAARPGLARAAASEHDATAAGPRRRTCSGRCSTRAGCSGTLYWWSVAPFHGIVFGGMARNIARAAEQLDAAASPTDASRRSARSAGRADCAHPVPGLVLVDDRRAGSPARRSSSSGSSHGSWT